MDLQDKLGSVNNTLYLLTKDLSKDALYSTNTMINLK